MYFKCCSLTFCCTINIISFRLCHVNKLCGLCLVFAKVKASCAPSRWAYLLWLVRSDDASVVRKLRAVRFGNWSNNPIGSDVSWWIVLAKPCWWRVDVEDYEVCIMRCVCSIPYNKHTSKWLWVRSLEKTFWYTLNISGMFVFFEHTTNSTLYHDEEINQAWICTIIMYISTLSYWWCPYFKAMILVFCQN